MKKSLIFLLSITVFLSFAGFALAGSVTIPNPLCPDPNDKDNCVDSFAKLIEKVTDYVLTMVGILAVLMLVISGILFVISGGSSEKVGKAKKMAIYAGIGGFVALAGKGLIEVIKTVINAPP